MESIQRLNTPITDRERRQSHTDRERLLSNTTDVIDHHGREIDPSIGRFRSLRGLSPQPVNVNSTIRFVENEEWPLANEESEYDTDHHSEKSSKRLSDPPYARINHPPKLWTPIWLRKWMLCLFLILFLCLLAVLIILWYLSRTLNGFPVSKSTTHYAWTYGPTAVLVIVAGLWRQVDYHCKSLLPWDELGKGPTSPSRSLLVDYISPLLLISLLTAFKRGHAAIVVSAIGVCLLKVIIIFSTGLLVLLPTDQSMSSFPATSASIFHAESLPQNISSSEVSFPSRSVYSYLGNLVYGLPYADGVTSEFAYIPVSIYDGVRNFSGNATYRVTTDALIPQLTCTIIDPEILTPTFRFINDTTKFWADIDVVLAVPGDDACNEWSNISLSTRNPQIRDVPPRQILGQLRAMACADPPESVDDAQKMLFVVFDVSYTQSRFANGTVANSTRTVSNISTVFCKPAYLHTSVLITNNTGLRTTAGSNITVALNAQSTPFDTMSSTNLTNLYLAAFRETLNLFGPLSPQLAEQEHNAPFELMALQYGSKNIETLLDSQKLKKAAQTTFTGIMAHYAAQELTMPANTTRDADLTWLSDRLHVDQISLWVMVAGFASLAIFALILLFTAPGAVVPQDPSLIATSAAVLARSLELNHRLHKQPVPSTDNLSAALSGFQYGSAIATTDQGTTNFRILVSQGVSSIGKQVEPALRWWRPIAIRIPVLVLTIAVPLALVAILEVLQQISDSQQGLFTVPNTQYINLYIRLLPALVLILVAMLVDMFNFNIAVFSPWSKLTAANTSGRQSLLSNTLGKTIPAALLEAWQCRQWGHIMSMTAAILASAFTVIVSGLYTIQDFRSPGPTQSLLQTDSFRLQNHYDASDDNGAASILGMMTSLDMTYPSGTYDELAFPTWSLGQLGQDSLQHSEIVGPFTATVPALRANLRCDSVPQGHINVSYLDLTPQLASEDFDYKYYEVSSSYKLPEACSSINSSSRSNSISVDWSYIFGFRSNVTGGYYGGFMLDLLFGANYSTVDQWGQTAPVGDNPAIGCPSLAITWGNFIPGSNSSNGISSLVCYQEIQQVEANVTFQVNSTSLDLNRVPSVNEASVVTLPNPNSTNGANSFDYRIANNINGQITAFSNTTERDLMVTDQNAGLDLDGMFTLLFHGSKNVEASSLTGAANRQTLHNALNHVYRRYMAQVFNSNLREPFTQPRPATDTVIQRRQNSQAPLQVQTTTSTPRIVQNKTSKIILQVLLGLSSVLILFAYILTPMRHVLPLNPCSIGATMSLLAGSELCHNPDDDSVCNCCGKPRRTSHATVPMMTATTTTNVEERRQTISTLPPSQKQIMIPEGIEFMPSKDFYRFFSSRHYSMGWWRAASSPTQRTGIQVRKRRRFGVDSGRRPDGINQSNVVEADVYDDLSEADAAAAAEEAEEGEEHGTYQMSGGLDNPPPTGREREKRAVRDSRGSYMSPQFGFDRRVERYDHEYDGEYEQDQGDIGLERRGMRRSRRRADEEEKGV